MLVTLKIYNNSLAKTSTDEDIREKVPIKIDEVKKMFGQLEDTISPKIVAETLPVPPPAPPPPYPPPPPPPPRPPPEEAAAAARAVAPKIWRPQVPLLNAASDDSQVMFLLLFSNHSSKSSNVFKGSKFI